jgi:hypothetical protein
MKEATASILPSAINATMENPSDDAVKTEAMQPPISSSEDESLLSPTDGEAVSADDKTL